MSSGKKAAHKDDSFVSILDKTDLFYSGHDGYAMVRIPALIASPGGTLLAFCKASNDQELRDTNRQRGSDTLLRRSFDGGKTWETARIVKKGGWHCVPLLDHQTGSLLCAIGGLSNQFYLMQSDDDGETWAMLTSCEADEIKRDDWLMGNPSTCHGIQLRSGRLIVPCYHQMTRKKVAEGSHVRGSHIIYSDDHGRTWVVGNEIAPRTEECTVLETHDGAVYVNMRRHNRDYYDGFPGWGRRAVAKSEDGGETWSELRVDENLIEYSCNASVLRLTDAGRHDRNRVLFSNPASKERREKLTIRLSYDECHTWPVEKVLEAGMSHYSDLAVLSDMTIGCLYEAGAADAHYHDLSPVRPGAPKKGEKDKPTSLQYHKISFARFSLEWLTDRRDTVGNDAVTRPT